MTPAQIAAIQDPARRAREAQGFISRGTDALAEVRAIRDLAILEWRKTATQRDIAKALGVTPGLIGQIDSAVRIVETKERI
jgi:hypothetical protein